MDDVTVTLPIWLPAANLFLGIIATLALGFFTLGAIRGGRMHGSYTIVWTVFVWACVLVILGGSLNQLGLIGVEAWTIAGTGGRLVAAITILTLATSTVIPPDDR